MQINEFAPDRRLARWRSFVDQASPLPFLFHVNYPVPELERGLPPAVLPWPDKTRERIERSWAQYELMRHKAQRLDDDRVPYLSNLTGTEIFAEAFGCAVHRAPDANPCALPLVHSAIEAERLKSPELSASSLAYLFDIADELYRRGGPGAIMKPVDIQSPMDVVALIWDKSDLFIAMIETPETVIALTRRVRELMTAFLDEWFKRYGTTYVAHYPDYVMHGGLTLSVDEVGTVNEEMFIQFFRDDLVALSERCGGLGIHCCADARHQWDNFRALPGLRVMNHNPPPKRPSREYIPDSLRFYGGQVVQMPAGWTPEGNPETLPAQFPPGSRVVFEVAVTSEIQARSIAERLQTMRAESLGETTEPPIPGSLTQNMPPSGTETP